MKTTIPLQKRGIPASRLVLGCMGFGGGWNRNPVTADDLKQAHAAVETALSSGITMFDHADIYAYGKAEQVFGQVLRERPELRKQIVLQSKCGIRFDEGPGRPARYDFSEEYILSSVDGILSRLGVDSLDILLLHRPDPLMEPEEVAGAFEMLKQAGKVKGFGVSNMSSMQIRFLQSYLDAPLLVNQLELNLAKLDWIEAGVLVNQKEGAAASFPEGTLEFCQMEHIQIQAWSPLAKGMFTGREQEDRPESVRQTAALVHELAEQKGAAPEAIVLAWLMRHPAGIQPVVGTIRPERIQASAEALRVSMTRDEWYSLYVSSRGRKMP
ncbi:MULTISPECIES: aldo/keto reductase [unclassified Paenibacillus]|uniref:aldo/keto reductase n=1 Tax=unclassified Paenibacillus TaxID=185978 RepID=UPI001AE79FB8|nr:MULTISPECIES: aldo/keto reductase [unclassified Paenibacillus]MBP1156715.1 putative oxidoreductase [Paenibacillus sp. PvP091]MBP1172547.1 putative oxidoreductase [Paenibacillus sp. PvR098]MBP2438927.1 putative oxidoreductase [Paenibacillus sp. PvP052]